MDRISQAEVIKDGGQTSRPCYLILILILIFPPSRRAWCWLSVRPSGWVSLAERFLTTFNEDDDAVLIKSTFLSQPLCFLQWKNFGLALLFCILQVLSFTWWVAISLHWFFYFYPFVNIKLWHKMCFVRRYSLSYIPFVRFVILTFKSPADIQNVICTLCVCVCDLCDLLSRDAILKLVGIVLKWDPVSVRRVGAGWSVVVVIERGRSLLWSYWNGPRLLQRVCDSACGTFTHTLHVPFSPASIIELTDFRYVHYFKQF